MSSTTYCEITGACSAVMCGAVRCSAVQRSAVHCSSVPFSSVQCCAVQCCAVFTHQRNKNCRLRSYSKCPKHTDEPQHDCYWVIVVLNCPPLTRFLFMIRKPVRKINYNTKTKTKPKTHLFVKFLHNRSNDLQNRY